MPMYKYPSIGHFQPFVKYARKTYPEQKSFDITGSIKIHGSHIDLVQEYGSSEIQVQSRNNVLDMNSDMMGVVTFVHNRTALVQKAFDRITKYRAPKDKIIIALEYAGGNIQNNVAFTQVAKCLIILSVKIDDEWIPDDVWETLQLDCPDDRIFSILDLRLPKYQLKLDMNDTGTFQNEVVKLVDQIETRCPFAFEICGVTGLGEGLVLHAKGYENDRDMYFKAKGDKHSESKVKTLKPMSAETQAKLKTLHGFTDGIITPRRFEQAYEYLQEQNMDINSTSNLGSFISWLNTDIEKECTDDIEHYGVDVKQLKKLIAGRAKTHYLARIKEEESKKE